MRRCFVARPFTAAATPAAPSRLAGVAARLVCRERSLPVSLELFRRQQIFLDNLIVDEVASWTVRTNAGSVVTPALFGFVPASMVCE